MIIIYNRILMRTSRQTILLFISKLHFLSSANFFLFKHIKILLKRDSLPKLDADKSADNVVFFLKKPLFSEKHTLRNCLPDTLANQLK